MTNFTDMLSKAKAMQEKMKEAQEQIKKIEVEGQSGGSLVKVVLTGDYELKSIEISKEAKKEEQEIINDLIKATEQKYNCYMLYVIQREDCKHFTIARDIDPEYSKLLTIALKKKVKILCYDCKFSSKGIKLNNQINFKTDE